MHDKLLTRTPLIECVPNFSEGRRVEVIDQIVASIRSVPGVLLLDVSSDADHHRSVVTFAGSPEAVVAGAFAGIQTAQQVIDLDQHRGQHPRIGATDVVPFVPLRHATIDDCVDLARHLGQRVGDELGIPVYLYEAAATRSDRRNLADIRRGEYEGLKRSIATDPNRRPDFGPAAITPAGATAIGARPPLIAYNVFLSTDDVGIAQRIARSIRFSSGGLPHVKALGLLVDGRAQVSINLTDWARTPLDRVFDLIRSEARRYDVVPTESEIVGLVPEDALIDVAARYLQLNHFRPDQVLERRLTKVEDE